MRNNLKNYFNNIQSLLIVVLAVLLLLQRSCSSTPKPEPKIITKVEVKWDTVKVENIVYQPKWKTKIEYRWDTIKSLISIDTVLVINDYFTKYTYTDTINFDSLGYVMVIDTITQNKIKGRNVQSNIRIPTKIITNDVYLNKRELFFGVSVGSTPTQVQGINGELLFINKKRQGYGIGVGLNPEFQPIYTGRLYWKIGK